MIRGVVLAGGKSRRFGSDKALAVYQGETFLTRAFKLLTKLDLSPVIVTRDGAEHSLFGAAVVYDYLPDKGPLGGIYTAMRKFPEEDLLVLTCDMPALEEKLLLPLLEEYNRKPCPVFYRAADGAVQPFPGIYPLGLFPFIFKNIFEEKLSMRALIEPLADKKILSFDGPPELLANINSPTEMKTLEL